MRRDCISITTIILCAVCLSACSLYKYVPDDEYLLTQVAIDVEGGKIPNISKYRSLHRQLPNKRWLGVFNTPLRLYSLFGAKYDPITHELIDRNIGQAPVIYNATMAAETAEDMRRTLFNSGYLHADVLLEERPQREENMRLTYHLIPGKPYMVDSIRSVIPDKTINSILNNSNSISHINKGMNLDISRLEEERNRIVALLQRHGYYKFNKSYIRFQADTITNQQNVMLTMFIDNNNGEEHQQYNIGNVNYVITDNTNYSTSNYSNYNLIEGEGYRLFYNNAGSKPALRPQALLNHSFLREGMIYNTDSISKTYSSLSKLSLCQYANINFEESVGSNLLNTTIFVVKRPKNLFRLELDGTNTAGDLGAAASVSLINRNLFSGSEQLSIKFRGAYESISGLQGYSGDTYFEYGMEMNLDFPSLILPFIHSDFQRRSQAITQYKMEFNMQSRPEFSKLLFTTGWSYIWSYNKRFSHKVDIADWNYLVVPWISNTFKENYLDPITGKNSILRYNYEDLLITKMGYQFSFNTSRPNLPRRINYSLRFNIETSGNMLYAISRLTERDKNNNGQFESMGIAFAQYAKADFEYTLNWSINKRDNLLLHFESGIAAPYLNSNSIPFEKRYFAGGANGVRGWSVRELGPGNYRTEDRKIDYIKQSGDIKLGASIEYRKHLVWKLGGALFVDAGNIWTIKEYQEQIGGVFSSDFYKQIALSYGAGLRVDLSFLVVRLDLGIKAINPSGTDRGERYPILHPNLKRDMALHLAVGYPF